MSDLEHNISFDDAQVKEMTNNAKGKQKENIEKLFAECKRLAEVAEQKNNLINDKQKEYDEF